MNQIYSIQDKKAEVFAQPFIAKNSAVAVRMFAELVKSPETQISRSPEDFALFWIGTFNEETGEIQKIKELEKVAEAQDYKIEKK